MKSRIQLLRDLVESDPGGVSYQGHSAFDVADMVKQYFRDLPEPIFTSHLCETFLHIYQCEQALVAAPQTRRGFSAVPTLNPSPPSRHQIFRKTSSC